ncbi:hypothetical protein ACFWXO_39410 [Kitasatospora sp. NPDC059088]|uniref:hypothetical protein n=1 Tax=Kitasatospora sp. NPDC059088 TaxID=3346722 RepID=UPI003680D971
MLCRKAGVPAGDVRGTITSCWARSTIASRLYNVKEPMTLFELQLWLGRRSPQSIQYYATITFSILTEAFAEAGYSARNARTAEVPLDCDAITSGAPTTGEPWQYYDLGHGSAPTRSSNSAGTGWPAPAVISTRPWNRRKLILSKPRPTCSACS